MDGEGVGAKFWLWLFGVLLAGAAILFLALGVFTRALYKWGFFGALLAFSGICILIAWFYDRRNKRRLDWDLEHPEPHEGDQMSDHMERF